MNGAKNLDLLLKAEIMTVMPNKYIIPMLIGYFWHGKYSGKRHAAIDKIQHV